jgi:hypothetical protein
VRDVPSSEGGITQVELESGCDSGGAVERGSVRDKELLRVSDSEQREHNYGEDNDGTTNHGKTPAGKSVTSGQSLS